VNKTLVLCAALLPSLGFAQSAFQGTWRPDPQKADPARKPDAVALVDGVYECRSCSPPYKIEADGRDHPVAGSRYYDTVSITVVDSLTLMKSAKQGGQQVAVTRDVISADGATLTETQTVIGMAPRPLELTSTSARVTAGDAGAHAISGEWRLIQTDLTRHEEDTTYKVSGNSLVMSDGLGRSFSAGLDGIDAPYKGDSKYSSVSLKMIDRKTIEEVDKKDGKAVQINRWSVDPDGVTMHVRFDDTQGHIQEQTGHKLP
jgi:hypothetical protein